MNVARLLTGPRLRDISAASDAASPLLGRNAGALRSACGRGIGTFKSHPRPGSTGCPGNNSVVGRHDANGQLMAQKAPAEVRGLAARNGIEDSRARTRTQRTRH